MINGMQGQQHAQDQQGEGQGQQQGQGQHGQQGEGQGQQEGQAHVHGQQGYGHQQDQGHTQVQSQGQQGVGQQGVDQVQQQGQAQGQQGVGQQGVDQVQQQGQQHAQCQNQTQAAPDLEVFLIRSWKKIKKLGDAPQKQESIYLAEKLFPLQIKEQMHSIGVAPSENEALGQVANQENSADELEKADAQSQSGKSTSRLKKKYLNNKHSLQAALKENSILKFKNTLHRASFKELEDKMEQSEVERSEDTIEKDAKTKVHLYYEGKNSILECEKGYSLFDKKFLVATGPVKFANDDSIIKHDNGAIVNIFDLVPYENIGHYPIQEPNSFLNLMSKCFDSYYNIKFFGTNHIRYQIDREHLKVSTALLYYQDFDVHLQSLNLLLRINQEGRISSSEIGDRYNSTRIPILNFGNIKIFKTKTHKLKFKIDLSDELREYINNAECFRELRYYSKKEGLKPFMTKSAMELLNRGKISSVVQEDTNHLSFVIGKFSPVAHKIISQKIQETNPMKNFDVSHEATLKEFRPLEFFTIFDKAFLFPGGIFRLIKSDILLNHYLEMKAIYMATGKQPTGAAQNNFCKVLDLVMSKVKVNCDLILTQAILEGEIKIENFGEVHFVGDEYVISGN